ncbi:MAG: FeoB-associated Cys-rich membrane protein [Clostridia bacterium]|nr:FeoB-associated Cys-rich membrane protein [Clostridia bacterium]
MNAGTIAVSLLLIALVTGIIVKLFRDKKKGKSSCGCNCGCCPMASSCHKQA